MGRSSDVLRLKLAVEMYTVARGEGQGDRGTGVNDEGFCDNSGELCERSGSRRTLPMTASNASAISFCRGSIPSKLALSALAASASSEKSLSLNGRRLLALPRRASVTIFLCKRLVSVLLVSNFAAGSLTLLSCQLACRRAESTARKMAIGARSYRRVISKRRKPVS